jgi:hypothetical protein
LFREIALKDKGKCIKYVLKFERIMLKGFYPSLAAARGRPEGFPPDTPTNILTVDK